MLQPGAAVDRYVVESVLGEGGMAVVYRVRHAELGTAHALKVLTSRQTKLLDRFMREARVQASLRHPNVLAVHDVLEVEGAPALLLEIVDGPSLEDWLGENRPSLAEAERLFRAIAGAVAEAHRRGMVHRDLKPANVLLARDGDTFVPKVADFGLVKLLDDETSQTRTGIAMGTPSYMAPEQFRNAKGVDARADVFALGCILYDLVCGTRPFEGADVVELLTKITRGEYMPPRQLAPELPDRVVTTIDYCLRPRAAQRWPDAQAVLAGLDGGPPPSEAPTVPREAPEPAPPTSSALTPPPPQATPVPRPAAALAFVGGAGIVVAGLLLLGGSAVLGGWFLMSRGGVASGGGVSLPPPVAADCTGGADGALIGWAEASKPFLARKGGVWRPLRSRAVYADRPEDGAVPTEIVCTLPRGASVAMVASEASVAGRIWVPIYGGAVTVPGAKDDDADTEAPR